MRDFIKTYRELVKVNGVWYKKHWRGTLVINLLIVAIPVIVWYIVLNYNKVVAKIKTITNKFKKHSKEVEA